MKNRSAVFFFLYIIFFNYSSVFSEEFIFETKMMEISDGGNLIYAIDGKATSLDNEIQIDANEFRFNKNEKILNVYGSGLLNSKNEKIIINFDKAKIDQNNSFIEIEGNIIVKDLINNLNIQSEYIQFDRKKKFIISNVTTKITDNSENVYIADNISYDITQNVIKFQNLNFKDNKDNKLNVSVAFLNTKSKKLFGKDIDLILSNKSFNAKNEPRFKSNSIQIENNKTILKKSDFTTCKKRDGCPPWKNTAKTVEHDKNKKILNYENAVISLYDIPVFYFPKFFHPDPTVERQSGFLIPALKSTSKGDNSFEIPYFWAISQNKDLTISPRIFTNNKFLIQNEYRQAYLNSNHFAEFSFFNDKKKDKNNHLFYNYNIKNKLFKKFNSELNLKLQNSSNDTYLKKQKISSEIVDSNDILENSLNLDLFANDLSIKFNTTIYENLDKKNNDRFEYIFPRINLAKNLFLNSGKGSISFETDNQIKNYNTNVLEKTNINNFIFNSNTKINNLGLLNNYKLLIKNTNSDSKNSLNYKNKKNLYLASIIQFNNTLPLIREKLNSKMILTPKISINFSPTKGKDIRNTDHKIDVNNIYSLNRISDNSSLESGASTVYGLNYSYFQKQKGREILNYEFANNLRLEENKDLPRNDQIGSKTSSFFNKMIFSPNEIVSINYNNSIKNNLSDLNYQNLGAKIKINNLVTSFNYLNENNSLNKTNYLENNTKYQLNKNNSFSFATRKNKKINLTEFYNLIYEYKNDCLAASFEYQKNFYKDRDIKENQNILFKLTFIPLGQFKGPNISN